METREIIGLVDKLLRPVKPLVPDNQRPLVFLLIQQHFHMKKSRAAKVLGEADAEAIWRVKVKGAEHVNLSLKLTVKHDGGPCRGSEIRGV